MVTKPARTTERCAVVREMFLWSFFCEIRGCVFYVGETGGVFYQRVQNHWSSIRCGRQEMEVAAHFSSDGHQLSNARFVGLGEMWKGWTTYRRTREQRWVDLMWKSAFLRLIAMNRTSKSLSLILFEYIHKARSMETPCFWLCKYIQIV